MIKTIVNILGPKWLKESNRPKHVQAGIWTAYFGTILCTFGAALGAEYKDKEYGNKFDWKDWTATMIGGVIGQLLQIGTGVFFYLTTTH